MPEYISTLIGWSIVVAIVADLLFAVLTFILQRSKRTWLVYSVFVFLVPILAICVAALAGAAGRSVLGAVAGVLVVAGTAAQILVAIKKNDGSPLLGTERRDAIESAGWALMFNGAVFALLAVFWP